MIRRILFRITVVVAGFAAGVLLASDEPAHAVPPGSGPSAAVLILAANTLAVNSLPTIIGNITTWITGLLIGVATLFLTIGAIRYLAAGGDPTEIEKAKSALKSALVGYALAILAPILLSVVQGWIGG